MSGDSTMNSNVAANSLVSPLSDSDAIDENEVLEQSKTSNPEASASESYLADHAEWAEKRAAMIAKLVPNLDDSVDEPMPPPSFKSRRAASLNRNKHNAAKEAEHFNITNSSMDSIEVQLRSRRRPFSRYRNQDQQKKALDVNAFDLTDSSVEDKQRQGFSKKYNTKKKKKLNASFFNVTDDSDVHDKSVEQRMQRVRRSSRRQLTEEDVNAFDVSECDDDSVVIDKPIEQRMQRVRRSSRRQLTEEDVNAFDVSECDEEEASPVGNQQQGEDNNDLVLALDEDGASNAGVDDQNLPDDEGRNSMDDSDESENEADVENQPLEKLESLVLEDGEADYSLDEEVDEDIAPETGKPDDASNGGTGENNIQQKNAAMEGSSNEQSSLRLEYHLSSQDNHSESRVSHESNSMTMDVTLASRRSRRSFHHVKSQFLEVESSRSRRSFQHVKSQFLEVESSRDGGLLNLGKGLGDILNVSTKYLAPVEVDNHRISPEKEEIFIATSDVNKSFQSRCNDSAQSSVDAETSKYSGKRRSVAKELFSTSETSSSGKDSSGSKSNQNSENANDSVDVLNDSVRPLDDAQEMNRSLRNRTETSNTKEISPKQKNKSMNDSMNNSGASNKSLRSRSGPKQKNKSMNDSDDAGELNRSSRGRTKTKDASNTEEISPKQKNKSMNDSDDASNTKENSSKQKNKSMNDSMNDSLASNKSLRSRSGGKGESNKSITNDRSSKENPESGNDSQQGLDEAGGNNRSLRNRSNKRITEEQTPKQNANDSLRSSSNARTTRSSVDTPNRGESPPDENGNESLRSSDDVGTSNRSLRNRPNKRITDDQTPMQNANDSLRSSSNARTNRSSVATSNTGESPPDEDGNEFLQSSDDVGTSNRSLRSGRKNVSNNSVASNTGRVSPDVELVARKTTRSSTATSTVTSSSDGTTGSCSSRLKGSSVLYDSLNSLTEQSTRSFPVLQIHPPSVINNYNNSMDSTVNETRQDPNFSDLPQSSDEMPAPKSLPARKRRLAKGDNNTPSFSSLLQKRKRNAAGGTDSMDALVEKENQVAVNNNQALMVAKVDYKCPKLKRPENWVTTKLYNWIITRLEPRYKLQSRLRAEEFVEMLCSTVKSVIKKQENYEEEIKALKYEMARLKLIETAWNFYSFIDKFLPWQFQDRSLPMPQAFTIRPVVTYEKGTLHDPIL